MVAKKKQTIVNEGANIQNKINEIIKKYPNLQLGVTDSIESFSKLNSKPIKVESIEALEDSLKVFSELASTLKIVTDSTEIRKLDSIFANPINPIKPNTVNLSQTSGNSVFAWSNNLYLEDSQAGVFVISYFATFNYYTDQYYHVNYISSASGVVSSSTNQTSEVIHFPGYYEYIFSYKQMSAASALSAENQLGNLAFNGVVTLICVYHYLSFTQVVKTTPLGVSKNFTVPASTFPKIQP